LHAERDLEADRTTLWPWLQPYGPELEQLLCRRCRHRPVQYLNDILQQDHRVIKRRVKAQQGFREFRGARRTIEVYEAMHMIRKGPVWCISNDEVRQQNQFIANRFELAA
jgi:transposase-like protein